MSDLKGVIDAALAHELVRDVIEEQTGNLSRRISLTLTGNRTSPTRP